MKNLFSRLMGLALFTAACTYAADAFAYVQYTCNATPLRWASNNATLRASSVSFAAGTSWLAALQSSVSRFNAHPSQFWVTLPTGDTSIGWGNGESETWFSTNSNHVSQAPGSGRAWIWWNNSSCRITESDVIYSTTGWSFSNSKNTTLSYTGSGRLFEGVAIHELGHFAGMNHENREYNMMGSDYSHLRTNGSSTFGYVGEDLSDGLVATYGSFGLQDVGVVHWKYRGTSGEYSTHRRTDMYNSSGALLPQTGVNGEPGFVVSRGQQVQVEFTYENNGRDFQSNVSNRIYLSTNDIISTSDTLLFSNTVSLGRANVSTWRYTVTIPSTLTPGNYWLGALLDGTNTISESNEGNNATYIGVRVQ